MHFPNDSSLVHSRKGSCWRIDVHRPKGVLDPQNYVVFLTGMVAADFWRSRYMPLSLFASLTECLEHARRELAELVAAAKYDDVPAYPNACTSTAARGPTFRVDLYLCRRPGGQLETMLTVYDADDDTAPMLIATDEQINELCGDCINVLRTVGTDGPPKCDHSQQPNSL